MHTNILSGQQLSMLPLIKNFSEMFYLVGGTALALLLGHRRSIDFNLFSPHSFDNQRIRNIFKDEGYQIDQVLIEMKDEYTFVANGVKFTFYQYQYEIAHETNFNDIITMPNQLTIGAMKAFALGKRAKWKDYVDLYFIFKQYSLRDVVDLATTIFGGGEFNEKLFREQLAYHEDMNYSEQIEFLPGFEVTDETVKNFLKEISLQM